ncbi:MAG: acyltransferase family protein [Phascolarctobacterium sp.]|nr:acyltransferase family protein [Candidatus Phascolarctobacterium caballi]
MGGALVTIFFLMSGFLLYLNNCYVTDKLQFYYKRWKTLFPAFYIGWIVVHLLVVIKKHSFFYKESVSPWSMLFSAFGIDGYASVHGIEGYYYIGEWFLGVIIVMYLLYPFLIKLLDKCHLLTIGVIVVVWGCCLLYYPIPSFQSLPACLITFVSGILLAKTNCVENKFFQILAIIMTPILYFVKMPYLNDSMRFDICVHIFGFCMFFILYWSASLIRNSKCRFAVSWLSSFTYEVFLIQHLCIVLFQKLFQPNSDIVSLLLIITIIFVTFILAWILKKITNRLLYSCMYIKLESRLNLG